MFSHILSPKCEEHLYSIRRLHLNVMDTRSLIEGAKTVAIILAAFIGGYALAILGSLVIGVLVGVATSGDITVSSAMNTSIIADETSFISVKAVVLSPYTTIAALVIVVVLWMIFFSGRDKNSLGAGVL